MPPKILVLGYDQNFMNWCRAYCGVYAIQLTQITQFGNDLCTTIQEIEPNAVIVFDKFNGEEALEIINNISRNCMKKFTYSVIVGVPPIATTELALNMNGIKRIFVRPLDVQIVVEMIISDLS